MSMRLMVPSLLILNLFFSSAALSVTPESKISDGSEVRITGGPALVGRSVSDTLVVMGPWGSGASFNGQFEDQGRNQNWNGWTHKDLTLSEEGNHWQVHTYNADGLAGHGTGNLAAWCGSLDFPACNESDPDGGYGNNWRDPLVIIVEVADPSAPCVVSLDAWINLDLEPGYDFLTVQFRASDAFEDFTTLGSYDGPWENQHMAWEITIPAGEYFGPDGNQVELRFLVKSDFGWSDEDCDHPSSGACQIDDITVHLDNGDLTTFDDFETGDLGNWVPVDIYGSGDFSQLRSNLQDLDPCMNNFSPQVCFVDDGVVVPETGGTPCIEWCYGPGGYIVNASGGLIPSGSVNNAVVSPVMPWPENHDGASLEFDVFVHENLYSDSPSLFYGWKVRSVAGSDPEAIMDESWLSENYIYYGGPEYRRQNQDFTPLLVQDARFVQVQLFIMEYRTWDWWGYNGTPAPYFDNVRVMAVDTYGPSIVADDLDLAQDAFPASGILDPENLSTNSVRFDSGRDVGGYGVDYLAQDFVQATISIRGEGTELNTPAMHYRLIPNPFFDSVRTSGLSNSGVISGTAGDELSTFNFDLPDTGFFYPGDVIHYYFTASQQTPGGIETAIVPADTSGFNQDPWGTNSGSPGICAYDQQFSIRALPSVQDELGGHPGILLWDNAGDPEFTASLRHDVNQAQVLALDSGYDLYRRATHRDGGSLGRNATLELLADYQAIFYFSGSSESYLLGDIYGPAPADLALLTQWLSENDNRGLFLSGDHVQTQLNGSPEGQLLLHDYLGVDYVEEELPPLINGSVNPQVLGTSFLGNVEEWIVAGYCPDARTINAVQPLETSVRLAEFANPAGNAGAYPYSALTMNQLANGTLCFSMPYDFRRIQQLPGWDGFGLTLRSRLLEFIASHFSGIGFSVYDLTPVPDRIDLTAKAYPNPFNPSTTISFNLPRKGHLNLKIFNIRGELVRTLADESHEVGPGKVVWNGDDQSGGSVSSGVYFYELRFGSDVFVEKMLLVK